jgi:hypothetical protein
VEQDLADKKRLNARRLAVIAGLSLLTGALIGFATGGFSLHGLSTFLLATLIAWVVYALLARSLWK